MKKLVLVVFALFLAVSVNAQQKEKKTFEGAVVAANLTEKEASKVKVLADERTEAVKAIKAQKLDKEVTKEKIKEVKEANYAKLKEVLDKEKLKAWSQYWKKK